MEHVQEVLKTSLEELERVLSTKTVVGEPFVIEGNTLIPLISIGFGFGAGGNISGKKSGDGQGAGTGGGGGIRPVALVIINKEGVRVEPIKSGMAGVFEHLGDTLAKAMKEKEDDDE
ncbi:sporulation protein YtfJ [Sulfurimonas sp. HSL-3221]|uniref:GerW family sporulation protein n=1 Tax=Thiomicrolovo TaxID=3451667 RepID=UPI001E3C29AC|nr:spore germination protein GerW family protein [Sulfurimonas sp. HSL-3221]UFS61564.1 sporulation protein YtfJ [Sulfurimonas sp. HSL-3221]